MKKLITSLTIIAFLSSALGAFAASNAQIKSAIRKYKAKNYIGCLQETQEIIKDDPSCAFAYYYQALSYAQLGKKIEAEEAYNKVITLNSSSALAENALKGIKCIKGEVGCQANDAGASELDKFIKSDKFYGNSVQSELNQKRLNQIKQNFNNDVQNNQKSQMPTNDEIAQAVKTLAKLGINPLAGMGAMNMTPESAQMMQMNMLLGNNQNNGMQNNLMPMLLMNQGQGKNISPELIQTMMMSNMAGSLNYDSQTY